LHSHQQEEPSSSISSNHLLNAPSENLANDSLLHSSNDIHEIADYLMRTEVSHSGPPPAAPLSIQELDEIVISEREIDRKLSCGICGELFVVGESVKRLPCKHWFHMDECLFPWLKLRNTCPICRFELPTLDYEYDSKRWKDQDVPIQESKGNQKKRRDSLDLMYM